MDRVLIVFNKWWEFEPGFACLLCDRARPPEVKDWWPAFHDHPRQRRNPRLPANPAPVRPRALFRRRWGLVEVWCISDLLEHFPDEPKWQSSSQRKVERLAEIFRGDPPSLVIAVGTAASEGDAPLNGSVVIGTKCFMHNSHPDNTNPDSNWRAGPFGVVLDSSLSKEEFAELVRPGDPFWTEAAKRFLPPPLSAAPAPAVRAEYDAVALGNVNVTDYAEYAATDAETVTAFRQSHPAGVFGSLETTHALIRATGGPRFLYVSGIVDRLGHFNDDVGPREYAQNAAAHNAGLAVAWLLPRLHSVM